MSSAIDSAVDAFRAALVERGALSGAGDAEATDLGRRAALLVESATAWRDHLGARRSTPQPLTDPPADLSGFPPAPDGTCYFAEDPLAALLEVTRGLTMLSEAFLAGRRA